MELPVKRYDSITNSNLNRKTSTTPQNKPRTKQPKSGIKPFLCIKGKLKIDTNSPKAKLSMKDRIRKFEKDKPKEKDHEVEVAVSNVIKPK